MRSRRSAIVLIIGMMLSVMGCSGGSGASVPLVAPGASFAAASHNSAAASCSLLTQTEAETAFGQAFLAPNGNDGEPGRCEYFNSNGFGLQVEIAHGASITATFDADKAKAGAGAADLAGVGDKAFEALQGRRLIEFIKAEFPRDSLLRVADRPRHIPRAGQAGRQPGALTRSPSLPPADLTARARRHKVLNTCVRQPPKRYLRADDRPSLQETRWALARASFPGVLHAGLHPPQRADHRPVHASPGRIDAQDRASKGLEVQMQDCEE